ncbi:hypothetical protein [Streptomyces acidiscabies]|uniref:Uncharacterized protein n=1 Tax=Streptomyces acidiscabies TaxID=42234 RepID=A0ABU4M082_9ACTN|nr:hypothetical protein [Streptomyces acidiscabies]MDX3021340.1 hypothetical protein [Streptomyces acidiscabies]
MFGQVTGGPQPAQDPAVVGAGPYLPGGVGEFGDGAFSVDQAAGVCAVGLDGRAV